MAETYGTGFIETARDKLVALVTDLKTTMATGYTPTFSYVYEKHNVARLQLNAVSVGLVETSDSDYVGGIAPSAAVVYNLAFTVRIHTAYTGGVMDDQVNARLLNSIVNKLRQNNDLDDGYFIDTVDNLRAAAQFEESATLGAECRVVVKKAMQHTQE